MATEITSLSVRISAELSGFQRGMRQVQKGVQRTEASFAGLSQTVRRATAAIGGLAVGFAGLKMFGVAKDAALASARFDTLGIVMERVGRNAGYSRAEMDDFDRSLRKTGISMIESRAALARLVQAQVDLAESSKLARIAQDAAVIGGINSSEAFRRMVHGIQSAQVETLRTIGLNVNFEKSYQDLAATLGKTVADLTEQERSQARVNAVVAAGEKIAGSYEAAMNSAGKVIGSIPRQLDDLRVRLGAVFDETLRRSAFAVYEALSRLNKALEDLGDDRIQGWGNTLANAFGVARDAAIALAAVAAGRLVVSLGAATASSVRKAQAALAEARAQAVATKATLDGALVQMNMARALGRTTGAILQQRAAALQLRAAWQAHTAAMAQASVMARTAAASMGVLRGAFALLGGWPGIIVTALGGLVFWLQRTKTAAADAAFEVRRAVMDTVAGFAELDEAATLRQMDAASKKIGELAARLKDLRAELAATPLQFGRSGLPTQSSMRRREEIQRQIDEVTRELEIQKGVAEELAKQYAQLAGARLAADRARDKAAQQEEHDQAKAIADVHKQLADALRNVAAMETLLGDSFDGNAARAKLYYAAIEDLVKLGVEPADEAVQRYAASLRTLEEATRAAEAAERERARLESAALGIVQQSLTAQQRYEQAVQTLRAALDQAIITQEQYNQAVAHLDKELARATRSLRDTLAEQGVAAGEALIRGLLTGARNMKDILKSTLINLAISYVMGPVKLALGIASPSKVFRGYGEALGDGLVIGITSRIGAVQAAAWQLAGAARLPALSAAGVGAFDVASITSVSRAPVTVNIPAPPAAADPVSAARDAAWLRLMGETMRELEHAGAIRLGTTG